MAGLTVSPNTPAVEFDPASFKDPDGRVFAFGDRIFRTLNRCGRENFDALCKSGLYDQLVGGNKVVDSSLQASKDLGFEPAVVGTDLIEHRRIPYISYPYEWSFDMLRDAALLTLDLMEESLQYGFILKDATPFNVQFCDGRPVWIDLPSFAPYRANQPWVAYTQFCSTQLYPLMLTAYRNLEFQPMLRGSIGGIKSTDMAKLLRGRDFFRRGVLAQIHLPALLERSFARKPVALGSQFEKAKFSKDMLLGLCRRLRKLISGLTYRPRDSEWAGYRQICSYRDEDTIAKHRFVEEAVAEADPRRVWDLGCNTGEYSEIAAGIAEHVVAFDIDPAAINALYLGQKEGRNSGTIQPLVGDLTNPSPALGWALTERGAWRDRGQADFFLALALVHHLVIGGNIPVRAVVDALASVASAGVVEFVCKKDEMVRRLLTNREDVFADYTRENFEAELSRCFHIIGRKDINQGTRTLYRIAAA